MGGRARPRYRAPAGGRRVQLRHYAARPRRPRRPGHRSRHRQIDRISHRPPPVCRPGVAVAACHPARPDRRSRHRRRFPPGGRRPPAPAMTRTHGPPAAHPLRAPVLWGVVWGLIQAAAPLGFWWLEPAVVYALSLALIAAVYIGFAVADGRPRIVAVEAAVAGLFVVVAAAAVTGPAWLLVLGFTGHGLKDLWQHRHHYVANTRWWPPFCLVVDWVAAAILVFLIATGVHFHH